MYNIIYRDYNRLGIAFLDDGTNSMAKSGLEGGSKDFETLEDALSEVRFMIKGGIPASAIRVVQIIPFDITVIQG